MMYNTPKLSLTIPLTRDNGEIDANDFNYRTKSVELILDLIERDHTRDSSNSSGSQILTGQYILSMLDRFQPSLNNYL